MAVKIEKTTDSKKLLKIISVTDSAIDWDMSYPDPEDLQDDEESNDSKDITDLPEFVEVIDVPLEKRKKDHFSKHHDESKLRFKEDDAPTLFVFQHPHRVDVARKMRELASEMYTDAQKGRKTKVDKDMFTSVFHNFYVGMEQGFGGTLEKPNKINGRITDDTIQALEDAEVFIELNAAFMRVYNEDRSKKKDKAHSEK
jgi:hypothetical protein